MKGPEECPPRKPSSSIPVTRGVTGGHAGEQLGRRLHRKSNLVAEAGREECSCGGDPGGNTMIPTMGFRPMDSVAAFSSDDPRLASVLLAPEPKGSHNSIKRTTMSEKRSHHKLEEWRSKGKGFAEEECPSTLFIAGKGEFEPASGHQIPLPAERDSP